MHRKSGWEREPGDAIQRGISRGKMPGKRGETNRRMSNSFMVRSAARDRGQGGGSKGNYWLLGSKNELEYVMKKGKPRHKIRSGKKHKEDYNRRDGTCRPEAGSMGHD